MIIVVGGTGFIGKHLSILLHQNSLQSLSFSRSPDLAFLQKHAPSSNSANIDLIGSSDNQESILASNTLVYLASASIPGSAKNSLIDEWKANIEPAINTISNAIKVNPSIRIIYLSSGGTVYGPNHCRPIPETSQLSPITPYAYGKIAIENYLKLLAETTKVTYTILRASNPVGKWHANSKQGFINTAIANINEDKPITLFGEGKNIRDYIDVDELCSAILKINNNLQISMNKTWNIGSGVGTSLNQIIQELEKITQKKIKIEYKSDRTSDLTYNVLDCSRIKTELGWQAELGIDEIIHRAWSHSKAF